MGKGRRNRDNDSVDLERDRIEMEGIVIDTLPGTMFKVKTDVGSEVLATLAGRLKLNHIRVLLGDRVICEVSPYDVTRGRIIWRG